MRESVIAAMRQLAEGWQQEASTRRRVTKIDPAADTMERDASELLAELARVEHSTRLLTVDEYAKEFHAAPTSVRRWCLRGELAGAEKNDAGDWEIPRSARRQARVGRHLDMTG
jgi:hypothetical protein